MRSGRAAAGGETEPLVVAGPAAAPGAGPGSAGASAPSGHGALTVAAPGPGTGVAAAPGPGTGVAAAPGHGTGVAAAPGPGTGVAAPPGHGAEAVPTTGVRLGENSESARGLRRSLDPVIARAQHLLTQTLWGPASVLAVVTVGLAYLSEVDPNESGHYPTCPSLLITGLQCPGCGTLRMLHALTHRDLAGAVAMNPLALVLLPVLVAYYLEWVWRLVTRRPRRSVLPSGLVWLFLVVVVSYWVLRNIPATSWLAPG